MQEHWHKHPTSDTQYAIQWGQEKQPHRKNRADKVSSSEHIQNGVKPLEKPIQLITKLLLFSSLI
jgi:hypothetical protein